MLSDARPGQYWAGGPPGNTTELTAFYKSHLDVPIVGGISRGNTHGTCTYGRTHGMTCTYGMMCMG